ncbi:proteoglycan 4 [Impatiens glandulifera]|uniref:proteoglycan 4 n=1 Tax=Impatiens glandulifera TaxID=253017 RepID=UPI001FB06056|nr:proteoglycan 4 [Impatiens glandulifera]
MADQRQQPSRFKFIWGGAGSTPPTTRTPIRSTSGLDQTTNPPIRRQSTRQTQPPPPSQSRPSVQPPTTRTPVRSASGLNIPKETKNEVEPKKLPQELDSIKKPEPSTTNDEKGSKTTNNSKETSKLASQESSKPTSTSQPEPSSMKPDLSGPKSATFEIKTSPKHPLEEEKTSKQTTQDSESSAAKESTLLVPQETTKPAISSPDILNPTPTSDESSISVSDLAQKTKSFTTKEPALLVPQETKNPTNSSQETLNPKSSISTSNIAQKPESSTTKEPALLVPQETTNPSTNSSPDTLNPKSSISTSDVAQKSESSTTKEPALLVPQETRNPPTSSPDTINPKSSISTSSTTKEPMLLVPQETTNPKTSSPKSETKTTQPKPEPETITKTEKLPQEADKTLVAATHDIIKIVRESNHKITSTNGGGDRIHPMKNEIKEDNNSSLVKKSGLDNPKYPIEGKQVTVITLAGENRGASMQLGSDSAKEAMHIHRGYQREENHTENKSKAQHVKETKAKEDDHEGPIMRTLINSNVQSINNSIVFNSSVSKRDPGVQFTFPKGLKEEESSKLREKKETFDAKKMQFEVTPSKQVAYEPRVRRRCLKGLLMESSDSDSDNPEKNSRHGCRYVRGEKSDMNIQIN